jgi:hypothetical protein
MAAARSSGRGRTYPGLWRLNGPKHGGHQLVSFYPILTDSRLCTMPVHNMARPSAHKWTGGSWFFKTGVVAHTTGLTNPR